MARLPTSLFTLVAAGAALAAQDSAPNAAPAPTPHPAVAPAFALQAEFAHLAKQVLPSIVTVRAFVRTGEAPAAAATGTPAASPSPATGGPTEPAAAAAATGWVAPIDTGDYPGFRVIGTSSGFVVEASGEVLTVNQRLRRPDGSLPDLIELETHDHARILAEIVGAEPTVDLAILQATVFPNGHSKQLVPLRLGDSEALQCGHTVFGFGDPAGPEKFVQMGTFIAQPNRDCYQDLLSAFYLQVGMVAPPEAYGGPLVDLHGDVIAILAPRQVTAGSFADSPRHGVEFGLPTKIVAGLYDSIRQVRSFRSPWLGMAVMSRAEFANVRGLNAFQALAKPRSGILIENVFQPGPAWTAGIQPGDFLVTFGQTRIFTPVDFQKALYLAGIGTAVKLELWRAGATQHRELVIEQRPAAATPR